METNAKIVELINGIILHGNHSHKQYSEHGFVTMYTYCKQAQAIIDYGLDLELCDLYDEIESKEGEDDFTIDFDGNEYRIISDESIWEIYKEETQTIVEECYFDVLKLDDIPYWIAFEIDWEQTAKNCYSDGYGHTFSSYDHSESEAAGYWIFRTR